MLNCVYQSNPIRYVPFCLTSPFRDLLSGVIMAATSVPQLIAYAETVGYAGYRGLATAGPPLAAWGIVTGSPFMNAGVTSITALMAKSDLDGEAYVARYGEEAYVDLVAAYSLYIGLASVVLALIGFGKLAKWVPQPVRSGFKWGCAVGVLVSAVPNGFFALGGSELKQYVAESTLRDLVAPFQAAFPGLPNVTNFIFALIHPNMWGLEPTIMFVLGTAFIMEGKTYLPRFLPPGTEVILVTAAATASGGVVGEIPALDPDAGIFFGGLRIPVEVVDVRKLVTEVPIVTQFGGSWFMLALSASIFAGVNFLSVMGIASGFENEDGIPWNAERELIAQGVSCGVAAAVGSAPVSGSMSRSLVSRMTGTTSQLACILTALCWIYLQPYMSIMTPTPKAALSAVIVSAVLKGIAFPKDLLKLRGVDSVIGWGTGLITAVTSPTQGFGAGLALFAILNKFRSSAKEKYS
jgi:MFS superfamily sulfate permease-like transporter